MNEPIVHPQLRTSLRDTMFRGLFKKKKNFKQLLKRCRGVNLTIGKRNMRFIDLDDLQTSDMFAFDLSSSTLRRKLWNDVSFLTRNNRLIILVEHQTILTPNLALKIFLYYTELIKQWLDKYEINIHKVRKKIMPPKPEMYIVYNGVDEITETFSSFEMEYRGVSLNIKVPIIDIRYDSLENKDVEDPVTGYAYFHHRREEFTAQGYSFDDAFTKARQECIDEGYLKGFIESEEFVMFKSIMDYEEQKLAEGEIRGEARGAENAIRAAIKQNVPASVLEYMAKATGITLERLRQLIDEEQILAVN